MERWLKGEVTVRRLRLIGIIALFMSSQRWIPALLSGALVVLGVGLIVWDYALTRNEKSDARRKS